VKLFTLARGTPDHNTAAAGYPRSSAAPSGTVFGAAHWSAGTCRRVVISRTLPLPPLDGHHRNSFDFTRLLWRFSSNTIRHSRCKASVAQRDRETGGRNGAGLGETLNAAPGSAWPDGSNAKPGSILRAAGQQNVPPARALLRVLAFAVTRDPLARATGPTACAIVTPSIAGRTRAAIETTPIVPAASSRSTSS
jgi:hypothetical protein